MAILNEGSKHEPTWFDNMFESTKMRMMVVRSYPFVIVGLVSFFLFGLFISWGGAFILFGLGILFITMVWSVIIGHKKLSTWANKGRDSSGEWGNF